MPQPKGNKKTCTSVVTGVFTSTVKTVGNFLFWTSCATAAASVVSNLPDSSRANPEFGLQRCAAKIRTEFNSIVNGHSMQMGAFLGLPMATNGNPIYINKKDISQEECLGKSFVEMTGRKDSPLGTTMDALIVARDCQANVKIHFAKNGNITIQAKEKDPHFEIGTNEYGGHTVRFIDGSQCYIRISKGGKQAFISEPYDQGMEYKEIHLGALPERQSPHQGRS